MTAPTYLDSELGKINSKPTIQTSSGPGDADKIPSTGVTGKIDLSLQAPETYTHVQNVTANIWTVNHNLGKKPSITILDSAGSEVVGAVQYISDNQVVISLDYAISGTAQAN